MKPSVAFENITWNYPTVLNIVFLQLAAILLSRFFTSGGRQMLAMMGGGPDDMTGHDGHDQAHAAHERPRSGMGEAAGLGQ